MSTSELKMRARENLRNKWGIAIIALLIFQLVNGIPSSTSILNYFDKLPAFVPVMFVQLLSLASIFIAPIQVGYNRIHMDFSEKDDANLDQILYGFKDGRYGKNVLSLFLMGIFIALWSMLLIIPGIIKSFSYAMTPFILADPEFDHLTSNEAITQSRYMMEGHKGELFILGLSFIGWFILVILSAGILMFYVYPYLQQATTEFYYYVRGPIASKETDDIVTNEPVKQYDPFVETDVVEEDVQEQPEEKDDDEDPFYY